MIVYIVDIQKSIWFLKVYQYGPKYFQPTDKLSLSLQHDAVLVIKVCPTPWSTINVVTILAVSEKKIV